MTEQEFLPPHALRPASYWESVTGIRVLDPDGWIGARNWCPWETPITREEFERRAALSTCEHLTRSRPGGTGGPAAGPEGRRTDQGDTDATCLDGTSPGPRSPGTALVGPLRRVRFFPGDASYVMWFDMPADTRDPLAAGCLDHHPACRCREAQLAEAMDEYRAEAADAHRMDLALGAVVRLHTPDRDDWQGLPRCGECHAPWPCTTFTVAGQAARYAAHRAREAAAARWPAYQRRLRDQQRDELVWRSLDEPGEVPF